MKNSPEGGAFTLLRINDLGDDERRRLVEHHLISYDLLKYPQRSAALISSGETVSVMLNEEDHLRIQGLLPGMQLERSAELAFTADDALGAQSVYAFDPQWGYLTSCPTNVGTGMRASAMLHLPAITRNGQIGAIMQAVAKLGLTVRGLYGEGSEAQGDLYQLSNQVTLGRSEEDVIRSLQAATEQIVGHERAMRERAEKKDMYALQDQLLRSWGEAVNARLMSAKELMRRYSDIRYAASMGYLHAPLRALDCLMMDLQPGSLAGASGQTHRRARRRTAAGKAFARAAAQTGRRLKRNILEEIHGILCEIYRARPARASDGAARGGAAGQDIRRHGAFAPRCAQRSRRGQRVLKGITLDAARQEIIQILGAATMIRRSGTMVYTTRAPRRCSNRACARRANSNRTTSAPSTYCWR